MKKVVFFHIAHIIGKGSQVVFSGRNICFNGQLAVKAAFFGPYFDSGDYLFTVVDQFYVDIPAVSHGLMQSGMYHISPKPDGISG